MIDQIRQDLSYALRTLRRSAGFSALVIGGLALGIGANAAIYSLIDAVLIRKLPVTRPDELIALGLTENVDAAGRGTPGATMYSYPLYRDVRDANSAFTGLVATGSAGRLNGRIDTAAIEPEHPHGRFVSSNYFSLLGVRPALGRVFGPVEESVDAPPRAVLNYNYWTTRFHSDPTVLGRTLLVDDGRVTITGVAAPGFDGEVVGSSTDIWLPIAAHDQLERHQQALNDRSAMWLLLIGRARPGLTVAQVRQRVVPVIRASIFANATPRQLRRLASQEPEYPISSAARGLSRVRARFAAPLETLMVGVALLLCIVCVNVANLLLARGVARRREVAMRLAMGASRGRIVRQLLTESLALAALSGALAVLVAWWASRALVVIAASQDPLVLDVDPNPRILLFTSALAVASVLLFGLVPSLRSSKVDLATSIRATGRSIAGGAGFGFSLIAAQVALSLLLLTGALTLTRGLYSALSTDLGFDREHLLIAKLDIEKRGYTPTALANTVHALTERIGAIPGVAAVTLSENGLFEGTEWSSTIDVPGAKPGTPDDSVAGTDAVGAGYARAIGARVLAGRDLTTQDEGATTQAVLVNASFAQFYFPGQSAVGRTIRFGPHAPLQIVGVLRDVRGQSLDPPEGHHARRVYYPFLHGDDTTRLGEPSELRMLIRTAGSPETVAASVRRAIATVDRDLPIGAIDPLPSLIRGSIHEEQLLTEITTAIGGLAVLLAAVGLFGVMSYSVARRTSEIGIRIALGAREASVAGMIVAEAARPVILGILLGVPLVLVGMRLLEHHITTMASSQISTVAVAIGVLALCGVSAAIAPALRASRIDPIEALRQE